MEIEAVEGQIAFAGILANQMIADYFNDDGVYENILTKMKQNHHSQVVKKKKRLLHQVVKKQQLNQVMKN